MGDHMKLMKLNNFHIVILSSIKWDFLWQRHQIIAEYFSTKTDVTFVETTGLRNPGLSKSIERLTRVLVSKKQIQRKTPIKNLKILPPFILPPTHSLFRQFNKNVFVPKLAKNIRQHSTKPILLITYVPTSTSLYLIDELKPEKTIYDCVLNFENFPGIPEDIVITENELIQMADMLIVDSVHLKEKHRHKKEQIAQIPAAVNFEMFYEIYEQQIMRKKVNKVTYFGGIDHYRIDWSIIEQLLEKGIYVELIGPAPEGIPLRHNHLIHQDTVSHQSLPSVLKNCDTLILPYQINDFTKGTFPAKLFECFATGKPIVATALPDLVLFKDVMEIGESKEDFTEKVLVSLQNDNFQKREERILLAKDNSWSARCNSYEEVLEGLILN